METDRAIDEHIKQLLQNGQAIEIPTGVLFSLHAYPPIPGIANEFERGTITIRGQGVCVFHDRPSANAIPNRFDVVPGQNPVI